MITRNEILTRSRLWPENMVPYSQNTLWHDGYRQDCSGYLSMCWDIPPGDHGGWGGQSTASLVYNGYIHSIDPNQLEPGDAIGICGPSTEGDYGHIVLFRGWCNNDPSDNHYYCSEQQGGTRGPQHHIRNYPYDSILGNWQSWRLTNVASTTTINTDINTTTSAEDMDMGQADDAFARPYTGTEPCINGNSWMAQAVEAPLRKLQADLATLRTELRAVSAARATVLTDDQFTVLRRALVEEFTRELTQVRKSVKDSL